MFMWLKRILLVTILCLFTSDVYSAFPPVQWKELDGSPSLFPTQVLVPNNGIETTTGSIVELDFAGGASSLISDTAYGASWDTVTTIAPSKNAVYDKIESIGAAAGDVTSVGDCTTGDCLDGTSDGGTWIKFYDAQGAGQLITGNLTAARVWTLPDETGTVTTSATALGGDATGTVGAVVVSDDSHAHTTTTLSGIDISADTNLAVTAPIVLTDDTLSITVLKDLVTTAPLTGGTDDILPGADADITLALTVAKDIVAGVGLSGGEDNVLPGADADTTLTLDLTEINSATFGSGTFTTLTFDAGVTDPVLTFGSGTLALTGILTADGFTLGTNENLTIGSDTFTFDAITSNDFELSDDLNINDSTPHIGFIDTTASEDDFEIYADGNRLVFTNKTDLQDAFYIDTNNNFIIQRDGMNLYKVGGTDVAITDGGTGASTAQTAINTLTAVSSATNEYILTKDTTTGNAIFKAAAGGGAPTAATYITQTTHVDLSAEQALGALATGILKSTTTTGVVSIAAAGTDYQAALTAPMVYGDTRFTVGYISRDVSLTGTQESPSIGFTPKGVIFFGAVAAASMYSFGMDATSGTPMTIHGTSTTVPTMSLDGDDSINITTGAAYTEAHVTTWGSDTFTITWVKTGSPTGTAYIGYFALR